MRSETYSPPSAEEDPKRKAREDYARGYRVQDHGTGPKHSPRTDIGYGNRDLRRGVTLGPLPGDLYGPLSPEEPEAEIDIILAKREDFMEGGLEAFRARIARNVLGNPLEFELDDDEEDKNSSKDPDPLDSRRLGWVGPDILGEQLDTHLRSNDPDEAERVYNGDYVDRNSVSPHHGYHFV